MYVQSHQNNNAVCRRRAMGLIKLHSAPLGFGGAASTGVGLQVVDM